MIRPFPRPFVRKVKVAYHLSLLLCLGAFGARLWFPPSPPSLNCESRWEGEIVALRTDGAGKFYCQRVDYSYRRKVQR